MMYRLLLLLLLCGQVAQGGEEVLCKDGNCTSTIPDSTTEEALSTMEVTTEVSENDENSTTLTSDLPETENATSSAVNTSLMPNATTQPNLTSSLPPPTTTSPPPVFPTKELKAVPCTCDLTVEACDVGCCCDLDCTTEDRRVFSHCLDARPSFPADPRFCRASQWQHRASVAHSTTLERSGLLCLHKDNLPDRHWLDKQKIVTTAKEFKHLESRSRTLPWPKPAPPAKIALNYKQPYYAGDVIWMLKDNNTLKPFALPTNIVSLSCESYNNVLYLEEWSSRCHLHLSKSCQPTLGTVKASAFYSGVQLLSSPLQDSVSNQSEPWLPVQPLVCSGRELRGCQPLQGKAPEPRLQAHTCEQVVRGARYVIEHNGTEGIIQAKVLLWIGDLPVDKPVAQELEVVFEWSGGPSHTRRRSGRPGYLQSAPLLAGLLNEAKTSTRPLDLTSHLSVLASDSDGLCVVSGPRRSILFNEDSLSQCALPLSPLNFTRSGCTNLSLNIASLLLGQSSYVGSLTVAAFGDSEWGLLEDWVPVVFKDITTEGKWFDEIMIVMNENVTVDQKPYSDSDIGACGGVPTSLMVHVLWASVGSYASPQSQVVGVQLRFGETQTLDPPGTEEQGQTFLTTSVSFSDITRPLNPQFAPPPKYEIRLPRDFFYPLFSLSSASRSGIVSGFNVLFTCVLFVLVHFTTQKMVSL